MPMFPNFLRKISHEMLSNMGITTPTPSVKKLGYTPEDIRKRRLLSFIKGIKVYGAGVSSGLANTVNEFWISVDTFDYDNLTFDLTRVSGKGLAKAGLDHEMVEGENCVKISYAVEKPGNYIMDIKYLDYPVPNSPFKINVSKGHVISVKDVVAYGKGLKHCAIGDVTTFEVDTKKIPGQITVVVCGQDVVALGISESKTGYIGKYIANAAGNFFLRVKLDGKHIPGSPFMVTAEKKSEIPESFKDLLKRQLLRCSAEKEKQLNP